MGPQNRRVPGQVVEAVHDDGDDNVEHNETTQKDETDEIEIGHIWAARFLGVHYFTGGFVKFKGFFITLTAAYKKGKRKIENYNVRGRCYQFI